MVELSLATQEDNTMFKIQLKRLLFEKDMNQSDFQRKTKIRYGTINAYYHGYVKRMNVDDLIKMCDTLDCRLDELIEYIPKEKTAPVD